MPKPENKGAGQSGTPASNTTLFLLMMVLLLHLVDRQIMAILAEPIKKDLNFSDTQIGLLTGIGFSFIYSILGIPIARLADRYDRRKIISIATASWSLMTAVSGLATGFISMLLARMGVAAGEAGGIPPLHSLVADLYPEHKRARAFSIVQLGGPLGVLIAFFGGGLLVAHFDWRAVFYGAGALGVVFAGVIWIYLPEPRRNAKVSPKKKGSSLTTIKTLLSFPAYVHLVLGTALGGFALYAMIIWFPSFLQRSFALPISQTGLLLGLLFGVVGGIGILVIGVIADRHFQKDKGAHAKIPALMMLIAAPFFIAGLLSETIVMATAMFVVPIVMASAWHAPTFAAIQKVATQDNRAMATAFSMFVMNMIGLGLGPLAVGMISDHFEPAYGTDSLRVGLAIVPVMFFWAAIHWTIAAKHLRKMSISQ